MKTYIFFALTLSLSTLAIAQDPDIIWQRTIGGSDTDYLNTAIKTNDNGFLIGGGSRSNISGEKTENSRGGFDIWIVKLDYLGEIEWQRTIGGERTDGVSAMIQTDDGGYLLGAQSSSDISGEKTEDSRGVTDYWIVKIDIIGNIEWQKTIGGSGFDELYCLGQAIDGSLFIGGHSDSPVSGEKNEDSVGRDYWVLKLNSSGNIIWQNTIGGDFNESLWSLYPTQDGGCILAGQSNSNISGDKTEDAYDIYGDFWVVKLDIDGEIEWDNTIGGTLEERVSSIIQTADGNYLVAGNSVSNISGDKTENCIGASDFWILKLDTKGGIIWQNTIGGNDFDFLLSVKEVTNGGVVLAGLSRSDISGDKTEDGKGSYDYWVISIDSFGNIINQNTIGGEDRDIANSVLISSFNTIILAGESNSDISADKTENSRGTFDFWVLELDNILSFEEYEMPITLNLYPNPAADQIIINTNNQLIQKIEIVTISGQLVQEIKNVNSNPILDTSILNSGVYLIKIYIEDRIISKKFIKE